MDGLYRKLIDKERGQIIAENAQRIKDSYSNLKEKWRNSCEHHELFDT